MAIKITSKPNVETADPDYPLKRFKDDTGIGDGTPLNILTHGDIIQAFLRLLDQSGRGLGNDLPDNGVNGYELYESLGFWQDAAGPIEFYDDGSFTTPNGDQLALNHNIFKILGNSITWMLKVRMKASGGGVNEMYVKLPAEMLAIMDGRGILTNNSYQLGYTSTDEILVVKLDTTIDGIVLTKAGGGAFDTTSEVLDFTVVIPITTTL